MTCIPMMHLLISYLTKTLISGTVCLATIAPNDVGRGEACEKQRNDGGRESHLILCSQPRQITAGREGGTFDYRDGNCWTDGVRMEVLLCWREMNNEGDLAVVLERRRREDISQPFYIHSEL